MQIKSLRIKAYRSWVVDDTTPVEATERLKKLDHYHQIREHGTPEAVALEVIGWSRATFYRWRKRFDEQGLKGLVAGHRRPRRVQKPQWTRHQEKQVLDLRDDFRAWGKTTLWTILVRDHGFTLSESSVGRILTKAMQAGQIKPCAFYHGRVKAKNTRRFDNHAKRWRYRMKRETNEPGELVQIDHMTVNLGAATQIKEFKAVCPTSKQMVVRAYSKATALNGKRFLSALINDLPFSIKSIQVDGGSEFQAEFEQACADLEIPLYVLPPKRPQYNGCVERANRTSRSEFYPFYEGDLTVEAVNDSLSQYQNLYNDYRPHRSLDLMTPNEYLHQRQAA